jgi:uncharacterized membrane protein HdeD (DUF308 family)
VLVVLGIGAMLLPVISSVAIAVVLGWLFLVGGIVGLVMSIMARHAPGFSWSLLSAIVTIAAGGLLIGWPLGAVISVTLVMAVFLAADGIFSILFAVEHRRQMSGQWGWLFVNGLLDLLIAGWVAWAFPSSAFWILGVIVGIDLLFGGFGLVAMAMAARRRA